MTKKKVAGILICIAIALLGMLLLLMQKHRSDSAKQFIEDTKAMIRSRVEISIPNVYIEGRVKSVYGIYRINFAFRHRRCA